MDNNICIELDCKKLYSKKCLDKKCGTHCKDIECEYHKSTKIIYEPSKLPNLSLLCDCTSYNTTDCINNLCVNCCNDEDCHLHRLYKKSKENGDFSDEDDNDLGDTFAYCKKCEKCFTYGDGIYKCDGCDIIYCDECEPYDHHFIKCNDIDCYYCRIGTCFNNRFEEERYCTSCFISDEPICELCNFQSDMDCWTCGDCDKTYCENCKNANRSYITCNIYDCYYCKKGNCHNTYLKEELCDSCYKKKKINDTDIIKLIDEKKYDEIFEIFDYNVKHYKTPQTGKCCICLDKKINCKTECKHGYCIDCFIKNTFIHKNINCAMCRANITNNIKLYNIK
jgi:hypothetical protein